MAATGLKADASPVQVVGLTHGMLPFSATEQVFCSLGSSMTMARNICEKSRSAILFSVSEARSSNRRFPFPLAKHPLGSPCRRSDTPFTVQLEQALRGNSADAAASLLIGCVQKKGFGLHPGPAELKQEKICKAQDMKAFPPGTRGPASSAVRTMSLTNESSCICNFS